MAKTQTRRTVSINGDLHHWMRQYCASEGVPLAALLEELFELHAAGDDEIAPEALERTEVLNRVRKRVERVGVWNDERREEARRRAKLLLAKSKTKTKATPRQSNGAGRRLGGVRVF